MAKLEGVKVIDMKDGKPTKITYEGAEYLIMDERAKAGDICFNRRFSPDSRQEDSFYEVTIVDAYTRVRDDNGDYHGWSNDCQGDYFEIYRKEETLKGKYAKIVACNSGQKPGYAGWGKWGQRLAPIGSVGKIMEEDGDGIYVDFDGKATSSVGDVIKSGFYLQRGEYMILNEAPQVETTPKEVRHPINVGDYAKVTGTTVYEDIREGATVKIVSGIDVDGDYEIRLLDGSDFDYAKPDTLRIINLNSREMVFAKAGRKLDEFKAGDIVEVIDGGFGEIKDGEIGVVAESETDIRPKVIVRGYTYYLYAALITPVESRVDAHDYDV